MFLFTAGAIPTLVGIVYTTVFPGKDAHVLAPLLIGILFLIMFGLWETYGNIKHPLTPTYVFTAGKGRDLTAPCIALAVVNMFYYSSSILWPTMINVFYTNGGVDWRYGVLLSTVQGIAITTGGVALAVFGGMIKRWHWQLSGSVFIMVLFGVLLALGNPGNKGLMIAFVFISQGAYGWAIYLSIAISQMGVEHKNLGLSGGLSGAARFAGGSSKLMYSCAVPSSNNRSCCCRIHHHYYKHCYQVDSAPRACSRYQRRSRIIGPYLTLQRIGNSCICNNLQPRDCRSRWWRDSASLCSWSSSTRSCVSCIRNGWIDCVSVLQGCRFKDEQQH